MDVALLSERLFERLLGETMLTGIIVASSLFYAAGWLWTARVAYRSLSNPYEDQNSIALLSATFALVWPLILVIGVIIQIVKYEPSGK